MTSSPDLIRISRLKCKAAIGVTAAERAATQELSIDIEFRVDARRAASSDTIEGTIDYGIVAAAVSEVCQSREFALIETLAESVASGLLKQFSLPWVRVLIRKISPLRDPKSEHVSIEIVRP